MCRVLLSSLTGNIIDEKNAVVHCDSTGTHYFKNVKQLKEWLNIAQAERIDMGGWKNADDYDGTIIDPESVNKLELNIHGDAFAFRTETNAKNWIRDQKQYPATG